MERYKITNAQRINKAGEDFDYYQLTLENSKGESMLTKDSEGNEIPFTTVMSSKHVHNLLGQKQVQVDLLLPSEIQALIDTATLGATVQLKKAGDMFVASENTETVSTDGGKTWITPKVGEKYKIVRNGFRIDYDKDVQLNYDAQLAAKFERGAIAFAHSLNQ